MTAENPYESPATSCDPATRPADYLRISNWNHAGVPFAIAFVIGPILLAAAIWLALQGRIVDGQGNPNPKAVAVVTLLVVGELVACVYALRVPVIWVEIGPTLRYSTLTSVRDVGWNDVQRIWMDREDWKVGFTPIDSATLVKHFVLVIQITDYKDLRVLVPTSKRQFIEQLMRQHPRFRESAYDDDQARDGEAAD